MGLDSVELLMEVENFFNISISKAEAEKISTIQDMVDTVARQLHITSNEKSLQAKIFEKLLSCLQQLVDSENLPRLNDAISDYLDVNDKEKWRTLETQLNLGVPVPITTNTKASNLKSWLISSISWAPGYDWKNITFEQLVDAICANNYEKLLNQPIFKSKYEIYICVMRITVDKTGVDYFEILPGKSFTSDLGID